MTQPSFTLTARWALMSKVVPRMPATPVGVLISKREAGEVLFTLPMMRPTLTSNWVSVTTSAPVLSKVSLSIPSVVFSTTAMDLPLTPMSNTTAAPAPVLTADPLPRIAPALRGAHAPPVEYSAVPLTDRTVALPCSGAAKADCTTAITAPAATSATIFPRTRLNDFIACLLALDRSDMTLRGQHKYQNYRVNY